MYGNMSRMFETGLIAAPSETLKTGLEFAAGTTDAAKRLVAGLFKPSDILDWYRSARNVFKTGDLVLLAAEWDPSGVQPYRRTDYLKEVRQIVGDRAPIPPHFRGIWDGPAHSVVKLPFESDAMWFVINRKWEPQVMCVIYVTPYQVGGKN